MLFVQSETGCRLRLAPDLGDTVHGGGLHDSHVRRRLARRGRPKHRDRGRRVHAQAVLRCQLQHILCTHAVAQGVWSQHGLLLLELLRCQALGITIVTLLCLQGAGQVAYNMDDVRLSAPGPSLQPMTAMFCN